MYFFVTCECVSIFSLYDIQPSDDGRYFCVVTNRAGTTRDFGTLFVTGNFSLHAVYINTENFVRTFATFASGLCDVIM
jgi:hypothetical protein